MRIEGAEASHALNGVTRISIQGGTAMKMSKVICVAILFVASFAVHAQQQDGQMSIDEILGYAGLKMEGGVVRSNNSQSNQFCSGGDFDRYGPPHCRQQWQQRQYQEEMLNLQRQRNQLIERAQYDQPMYRAQHPGLSCPYGSALYVYQGRYVCIRN